MDIGSSFTYMFEDENWLKKVLIGGVVAIIPIVNFAAYGYLIQVLRNTRDGQPQPLPEWDQFGQYFMDGLWLFLINLVYSIPLILLACLGAVGATVAGNNSDAQGAVSAITICLNCVSFLWSLLIFIITPALWIRFAEVGEFMVGFRFGELFSIITANIGSYVIVLLLLFVIGFIGGLGLLLCVIPVILTAGWAVVAAGNLIGQLAAQVRQNQPAI